MKRVELISTSIIETLLNYCDKLEKIKVNTNSENLPNTSCLSEVFTQQLLRGSSL